MSLIFCFRELIDQGCSTVEPDRYIVLAGSNAKRRGEHGLTSTRSAIHDDVFFL